MDVLLIADLLHLKKFLYVFDQIVVHDFNIGVFLHVKIALGGLCSLLAGLVDVLLVEFRFKGTRRDVRDQLTGFSAHACQSQLIQGQFNGLSK